METVRLKSARDNLCTGVNYYDRRSTKQKIKTHPERKNMAASVFFLKRTALRGDCLQARSYLLQRGGCGQCWEPFSVDGLTGTGAGAVRDGGHCSCEPWVENV